MPARKAKEWSEEQISDKVREDIEIVFERLLKLTERTNDYGETEPVNYPLTVDGKEIWLEFFREHAQEQHEMSGDLAAAWSKLEGATARIGLVTHLVRMVTGDETLLDHNRVDGVSIWSAVLIARWFKNEVHRVYGALSETDQERKRREGIEVIKRRRGRITARDLSRASRRFTNTAEEFLIELVRDGVGHWIPQPPGPQGGRPCRVFELLTQPEP